MNTDERTLRLDKIITDRGLVKSRKRAQDLIKDGKVLVNKKIEVRPDKRFNDQALISIVVPDFPWVSRGGLKLEKALNHWHILVEGWTCIDIGAATGGFTDVLLKNGALKVYAVDVGHDQLAEELRNDPRIERLEGVNARRLSQAFVSQLVDFICIDVSYISLEHILPEAIKLLKNKGKIVALIKPQFELGRGGTKKGIVKDSKKHQLAIDKIQKLAETLKLKEIGLTESPILGGKGNKEFLIYLQK